MRGRLRKPTRLLCFLAAMLLVSTAISADLKINVQSFPPGLPLAPGTAVLLSIEGCDPIAKPQWHRTEIDGDVVLAVGRQYLFAGTTPGPRTFVVQIPQDGADPFAVAMFNYGEDSDDENPPLPPVPPGEQTVVLVYETGDRTRDQSLVLARLEALLIAEKRAYKLADQNRRIPDRGAPAWLQPILATLKTETAPTLPVIAVVAESAEGTYSVVGVEALPDNATEAIEIVRRLQR